MQDTVTFWAPIFILIICSSLVVICNVDMYKDRNSEVSNENVAKVGFVKQRSNGLSILINVIKVFILR